MPLQKSAWNIPKVHAISHFVSDVKRGGITSNYSAECWEHLHIETVKNAWRRSNKKDVEDQIIEFNFEKDVLQPEASTLDIGKKDGKKKTNWDKVSCGSHTITTNAD